MHAGDDIVEFIAYDISQCLIDVKTIFDSFSVFLPIPVIDCRWKKIYSWELLYLRDFQRRKLLRNH